MIEKAYVHRQASRRVAVAHRGLGAVPEPAGARPALPAGDGRPRARARQDAAAGPRGVGSGPERRPTGPGDPSAVDRLGAAEHARPGRRPRRGAGHPADAQGRTARAWRDPAARQGGHGAGRQPGQAADPDVSAEAEVGAGRRGEAVGGLAGHPDDATAARHGRAAGAGHERRPVDAGRCPEGRDDRVRLVVCTALAGGAEDAPGIPHPAGRASVLRRARGGDARTAAGPERPGPAGSHRPAWLSGPPGGRGARLVDRPGEPGQRRGAAEGRAGAGAVRGRPDGDDAAGVPVLRRGAGTAPAGRRTLRQELRRLDAAGSVAGHGQGLRRGGAGAPPGCVEPAADDVPGGVRGRPARQDEAPRLPGQAVRPGSVPVPRRAARRDEVAGHPRPAAPGRQPDGPAPPGGPPGAPDQAAGRRTGHASQAQLPGSPDHADRPRLRGPARPHGGAGHRAGPRAERVSGLRAGGAPVEAGGPGGEGGGRPAEVPQKRDG